LLLLLAALLAVPDFSHMQGTVEVLQGSLSNLSAHVLLNMLAVHCSCSKSTAYAAVYIDQALHGSLTNMLAHVAHVPCLTKLFLAGNLLVLMLQGTVEALQGSLSNLSAHVALRARALDPAVAAAAAAAGLEGGDLDLNTLDNMEPEREWGFGLRCMRWFKG
jgi:hypothetical protein